MDLTDFKMPNMMEPVFKAFKSKKVSALFSVLPALAGVQSAIAPLLKGLMNHFLAHLETVQGDVESVQFNGWRSEVVLKNISLRSPAGKTFPIHGVLKIPQVTLWFSWKNLLKGSLIGDLMVDNPRWNAVWPPDESLLHDIPPHRRATDRTWKDDIKDCFPFRINRLVVRGGQIFLSNVPGQENCELSMKQMDVLVRNLTNNGALAPTLETSIEAEGEFLSHGWLQLHGKGFPLSKIRTLDADLSLSGVNLRSISPLFEHWMGVRLTSGVMDFYAEAAAAQGYFKGYVKPVISKLEVETTQRKFFHSVKVVLFKIAAKILRNKKADRIATVVNFSGEFPNIDVRYGEAMFNFLKNAFSHAFKPKLDGTIGFSQEARTAERTQVEIFPKTPKRCEQVFSLTDRSVRRWMDDNAIRMSAALSYYTVFSLAPLLILMIAIAGMIFGEKAAQGQIADELSSLVGSQGAQAMQTMIQSASKPFSGVLATLISVITLLVGASGVTSELKSALNKIWEVDSPSGLGTMVKGKLLSYAMVLAIGFLLLFSLLISAGISAAGKFLGGYIPFPVIWLQLLNSVLSFGVITVLFAMIYKTFPDAPIHWRDVWVGSAVTAALFGLGKLAIGLYIKKAGISSSYGAAGSVLVLLVWVYYSAMILYLGAEFTKVYSDRFGSTRFNHAPPDQTYPQSLKRSPP